VLLFSRWVTHCQKRVYRDDDGMNIRDDNLINDVANQFRHGRGWAGEAEERGRGAHSAPYIESL
jgi:hypothetical protein